VVLPQRGLSRQIPKLHLIAGKSGGPIYTAPQTFRKSGASIRLHTFTMVPKPIDIDSVMMFVTGKSKIHRRYVTPGAERNTSIDEPSPVHVRDARPIQNEMKLDTYGFQLIHHESKVFSVES
jgi:hypothetical protein